MPSGPSFWESWNRVSNTGFVFTLALALIFPIAALSSPAPAPNLQYPASGAQNLSTDLDLQWTWTDELLVNGSFEQGFANGWSLDTSALAAWAIYTNSDYTRFAGTSLMYQLGNARMVQDVYVPADATSVQLTWQDRLYPAAQIQPPYRTRLIIWALQSGVALQVFGDVDGDETEYALNPGKWIPRSANLDALAGQWFQIAVECRRYSPAFASSCWVDVDAFSLKCVHGDTPEFRVFVGTSSAYLSTNYVGSTTAPRFSLPALAPFTTYYWRVASVRDGVTNYSAIRSFKTGPSSAPRLAPVQTSSSAVTLRFESRLDRFYAIEQRDTLDDTGFWYEILPPVPGIGGPQDLEVPLPGTPEAYWRLRVTP